MFREWVKNVREALQHRARQKEVLSRISWMVECELFEVEQLERGFDESYRINSIYLSPGTWLAIANPAMVDLSKLIDFEEWRERLSWSASYLRVTRKAVKEKNYWRLIGYLEERLGLMQTRFDWTNHNESGIEPKEAVEAKFETTHELRRMINDLKEYYKQEKGHHYS